MGMGIVTGVDNGMATDVDTNMNTDTDMDMVIDMNMAGSQLFYFFYTFEKQSSVMS
jgi:hypothetical protein